MADTAFVCTGDPYHEKETLMALEKDYHVFLEKPMTITEESSRAVVAKAEDVEKYYRLGLYYDMVRFSAKLKKSSMPDG